MSADIEVKVTRDTATPAVDDLLKVRLSPRAIKRAVGQACVSTVQDHLGGLGPNKRGWPTTGFYAGAARGTTWDFAEEGVVISVDNARAPGSMRQRFHGGTIRMKDKLLAIPARAEFYGRSPTDFTNLRFVAFKGGGKALIIGKGGVGLVDFGTGRERNVKGAGARSEMMVAYWLREEVNQAADPSVMPSQGELAQVAIGAVAELAARKGAE